MTADHIPFVFNDDDCKMVKNLYSDSPLIRVPLEAIQNIEGQVPAGMRLWVDGGIDGLATWDSEKESASGKQTPYSNHIKRFAGYGKVSDPTFHERPEYGVVKNFVRPLMDMCCRGQRKPYWVSVPQLPVVRDATRNKINRSLAQAAGEWKMDKRFGGKMILPVVLIHQDQATKKTQRRRAQSLIQKCYELARADGVWVIDSSLNDQGGAGPLEKRFQGLIQFHQELNELLPSDSIKIAGPYWGMNLVLWARGLVQYPAVGLGRAYKYYLPGGPSFRKGKAQIAIPPLKRRAIASPKLETWLKRALAQIPPQETSYSDLAKLLRQYQQISRDSRVQVAEFYKGWFDNLANVPISGRALALYQQLSSAYVLGKSLPGLPPEEKTARRPERIAQQLMLSCL